MEQFPTLKSNFVECFVIHMYFLAAYPGFLVLGLPVLFNKRLRFRENSYLLISNSMNEAFFEALLRIHNVIKDQIGGKPNDIFCKEETFYETPDYKLIFKVCEKHVNFFVSHALNQTNIKLDLVQFNLLLIGYKQLILRPLCFSTYIYNAIDFIMSTFCEEDLNTLKYNLTYLLQKVKVGDSRKRFFLKSAIERHKIDMIIIFELSKIIINQPSNLLNQ